MWAALIGATASGFGSPTITSTTHRESSDQNPLVGSDSSFKSMPDDYMHAYMHVGGSGGVHRMGVKRGQKRSGVEVNKAWFVWVIQS